MWKLGGIALIAILATAGSACHAQTFVWAKKMGGIGADTGNSVALGNTGHVYTTGYFALTADFDPGPGRFNLSAGAGGYSDIFISRLNRAGQFVWARRLGGARHDAGYGIAVDEAGAVYTTGIFHGVADFDPGPGAYNLKATNGAIFVSKLDSQGDFVWAQRMGGGGKDSGTSIAVDSAGNVYVAGYFQGTADFDPGPGTFHLTAPPDEFSPFVVKLDESGSLVWARGIAVGAIPDLFGLTLDGAGGVIITGSFAGSADFDPGPGVFNLTALGFNDAFVLKLDTDGNFLWARQMGGNQLAVARGVAADAGQNLYIAGFFYGTVDFDPGPGTVRRTSAGETDAFLVKLNQAGEFGWTRILGGVGFDEAFGISVKRGSAYVSGFFEDTMHFPSGSGIPNLVTAGEEDIFVSRIDRGGDYIWAKGIGGPSHDVAMAIGADGAGNVHMTGTFDRAVDFDPGPGTFTLDARHASIFVTKFAQP